MEETYERQLETIVGRLPTGGCVVALVPTIDDEHAAALASDAAGSIGRGRAGHTLLLTLDRSGALDHEIGVEGGHGLAEVLAGEVSLARAAAHGRARGFIFVPGGSPRADQVDVPPSAALGRLVASAIDRGGTVLIHGRRDDIAEMSFEPAGVVWLGPAPDPAEVPSGWHGLGELLPPGYATGPGRSPEGAEASSELVAAAPTVLRGPARSPRRGRMPRSVTVFLIAVVLGAIALTAFIVGRSRVPAMFLPDNDSLWLAPSSAPDSARDASTATDASTETDSSAAPDSAATPDDTNS